MGNNAATGILQSPPPTTTTKQRIYIDDDDDDDNHDDDDGYSMKCHADDAEDDRNASPTLPNCNTVGEINKDDSGTTMMNISSPASNASTTVGHDGNGSVADNDEATPPPATTDLTTPALANMDFEKFELSITEGGDRHSKEEEDDMNRDECQQKRPRSGNGNIISNVGEEDSSSSMLLLASDKHWKTYSSNDVDDAILNELNVLVEVRALELLFHQKMSILIILYDFLS